MTMLAKARTNRLPTIVNRLDRLDAPRAALGNFHDGRPSARNVTLRHVA